VKTGAEINEMARDAIADYMARHGTVALAHEAADHMPSIAEIAVWAVWNAISEQVREHAARQIELTMELSRAGRIDRPKYEKGGFLNDGDWAAKIVRDLG
jgi:hypothetical protein